MYRRKRYSTPSSFNITLLNGFPANDDKQSNNTIRAVTVRNLPATVFLCEATFSWPKTSTGATGHKKNPPRNEEMGQPGSVSAIRSRRIFAPWDSVRLGSGTPTCAESVMRWTDSLHTPYTPVSACTFPRNAVQHGTLIEMQSVALSIGFRCDDDNV
uniref:Uncharacterized protein n=1 Tax=Anopheles culicifacies TaxID=139723 RepID=A0A182M8Z4_9DIPT